MGGFFGQSGANPFALQLAQTLAPYLGGNLRARPLGPAFGSAPFRSVETVQGTPYNQEADRAFQTAMAGLGPAGTQDWLNQWAGLRSTYSTLYSPQVYEQLMRNQLLGSQGGVQISDNTTALNWQLRDIVNGAQARTDANGNYLLPQRNTQGAITNWFSSANPLSTLGNSWTPFQLPNDAITPPTQAHYDPPPPAIGFEPPGQPISTYLGQPAPQQRASNLIRSNFSNPFRLL